VFKLPLPAWTARSRSFFGIERERHELPPEVWPLGVAPFIRLHEHGGRRKFALFLPTRLTSLHATGMM